MKSKLLEEIKMIAKFYHDYGKYPSTHSNNHTEKRFGRSLDNFRSAKKGKNRMVWCHEYDELAKELKCSTMFDGVDYKQHTLDDINSICNFYKSNGKCPSPSAKKIEEKKLGIKLSILKRSMQGKGNHRWYPEYKRYAIQLNCPDIFQNVDFKEKTLNDIKQIVEFYHKNKRYPKQHSSSIAEKCLAIKLNILRLAKKGKGSRIWYHEYDDLAEKIGHSDIFNNIRERIK